MVTITGLDINFGMVCILDMFQVITYFVVHIDMVQIMVMDTDIKDMVILLVSSLWYMNGDRSRLTRISLCTI